MSRAHESTRSTRHRRRWGWTFVIGVLALGGIALALVIPNQDRRWVATPGSAGVDLGSRPPGVSDGGGLAVVGPGEAILGTLVAEVMSAGGLQDLTPLIGRRVVFDVRWNRNDVAFWTGSPPYDLLVVPERDTRSGLEQQMGLPSDSPVHAGTALVRMRGRIEPIPYAEAMYSWRLTRPDVQRLAEHGVYVRVYEVVPLPRPS